MRAFVLTDTFRLFIFMMEAPVNTSVLLLNIDYTPLEVISWQRAMSKLAREKVELVEDYAGRFIRTSHTAFPFPAVVRLTDGYAERRIRFSRKNILARDCYTCQYCGIKPRKSTGVPRLEALTIDHVVPRAQSINGWVTQTWGMHRRVRVSCWENVMTACERCNTHKAARTPQEARMHMRKKPQKPSNMDIAWMSLFRYDIPNEWQIYLPENSPWRDYWDGELEG